MPKIMNKTYTQNTTIDAAAKEQGSHDNRPAPY